MAGAVRRPLTQRERNALSKLTAHYEATGEAHRLAREALYAEIAKLMLEPVDGTTAARTQVQELTSFSSGEIQRVMDKAKAAK